ncbi:MAG: hypothetical protein HWD59_08605 [Coxiellaceae bacterium]|nr:MAG: hypothetical protein HWD59_08605 [Coxiellaceae bacterium]
MQIKSLAKNGLFWLVLLVLLILRRPDQLFHAYIWDEDKNIILQWFELGTLKTFLAPINGYLVTVPKLINYFGLKLSFAYYPEISTGLAILFNLFSILMVAYAPNLVGWRKLAALAVIVVPTGAEIYILPLYTLWFAGLLLIIVLLWQMTPETKGWYLMRALLVCIGGSSSPLIVALMPAFWLRFIILKRRREAIIAAMSTVLLLFKDGSSMPIRPPLTLPKVII